jgi:hypothetical protein
MQKVELAAEPAPEKSVLQVVQENSHRETRLGSEVLSLSKLYTLERNIVKSRQIRMTLLLNTACRTPGSWN